MLATKSLDDSAAASSPAVPDPLDPASTNALIRAAVASFNRAHAALTLLFADIRNLQRHVASLEPGAKAVRVHLLPADGAKRPRGRPKGSKTRIDHIYVVAPERAPPGVANGRDPHV